MINEQELVRACQRNDRKAQTAFYNMYKGKLMGVCRRYARSKEEAEDIYQEAFVKIFNNIKSLEKPEAVGAWVRKTVIHTAINFYHSNLKFQQNTDYEAVVLSNDDYPNILAALSNEDLLALIHQLPDGYRMVFNLYVIDGYNHVEIGNMLGISENTSKSQLSRAKELLRKQLKKLGIVSYERIQ
ncbi:RNA polymerase sigma factor [Flectobacillus major]|jgi:RNA polymerase sigma-70 factor (ECF subfamily)|uniref:RNA polymerase sigma factor n=1 Tax=Flectobacillus major TaxID=103 RepID=UPI0005C6246D|nr:RNA polymerase sigma factor [Flectobacillus major]